MSQTARQSRSRGPGGSAAQSTSGGFQPARNDARRQSSPAAMQQQQNSGRSRSRNARGGDGSSAAAAGSAPARSVSPHRTAWSVGKTNPCLHRIAIRQSRGCARVALHHLVLLCLRRIQEIPRFSPRTGDCSAAVRRKNDAIERTHSALMAALTKEMRDNESQNADAAAGALPQLQAGARAAALESILELAKSVVNVHSAQHHVMYHLARLHHTLVQNNCPPKRASHLVMQVAKAMQKVCKDEASAFFTAIANNLKEFPHAFDIINDEEAALAESESVDHFWLVDVMPTVGTVDKRKNFSAWSRLHELAKPSAGGLSTKSPAERAQIYKKVLTGELAVAAVVNEVTVHPQLPDEQAEQKDDDAAAPDHHAGMKFDRSLFRQH